MNYVWYKSNFRKQKYVLVKSRGTPLFKFMHKFLYFYLFWKVKGAFGKSREPFSPPRRGCCTNINLRKKTVNHNLMKILHHLKKSIKEGK